MEKDNLIDSLNDAAVISAFKDKTKEMFHELGGMDSDTVETFVKIHVQELISEYNLDATIEDAVVSGSRCRGMETEDSDLDVVLYFSGSEREDSLFNLLHEDGIVMGGIALDINPISKEQTGSLSEYLTGVETYLQDRQKQMDRQATQPDIPEQNAKPEEYKPLAKVEELLEENYNQIDNQLSNIPPDPEERKAQKQEKTQCQEEHQKIRRRASLKEKLAEKKAEVAGKTADSRHHERERRHGL